MPYDDFFDDFFGDGSIDADKIIAGEIIVGVTGTYVETAVADVRDGTLFGPDSALEGELDVGSGGSVQVAGFDLAALKQMFTVNAEETAVPGSVVGEGGGGNTYLSDSGGVR